MQVRDPFGKLSGVGDGGGQEDVVDIVRKQDDGLLPDDAALLVSHVVDLVEDDPADLAGDLRSSVEHGPQDLGRHDEAGGRRVDGHVPGDEADVGKLFVELAVLTKKDTN